jgi:uncharacterized protein (DUF342 family)
MNELNNFLKVNVSNNKMEASITQLKALTDEISSTKEDIIQFLNENGLTYGIDIHNVEEIVEALENDQEIKKPKLIAKGLPPVNGTNAYLLPVQFAKELTICEDQLFINLKEVMKIPNVTQEQLVGKKIPLTAGEVGTNIYGEEIPSKPGKDFQLRKGKNTRISSDRLEVYAIVDGQVCVKEKVIDVLPVYEVNGDLSLKVGNIDFVGNVTIKGNVPNGFTIKAKGNIRVHGSVEAATLEAGGSIFIQSGIAAQGGGNIKASYDLHTVYINQGNVEVGGNLHVDQGILQSNCLVDDSIYCTKGKGTIVGGTTYATNNIKANEVGNELGTLTAIYMGPHSKLLEKEGKLEDVYNSSSDELEKLQNLKKAIELKEGQGTLLSQQERITKLRIRSSMLLLNERMEQSHIALSELRNRLSLPGYGSINILKTMHPNIKIMFGKYTRQITKTFKTVKVSLIEKEIKVL